MIMLRRLTDNIVALSPRDSKSVIVRVYDNPRTRELRRMLLRDPDLFFESGIKILGQKREGELRLLTLVNPVYSPIRPHEQPENPDDTKFSLRFSFIVRNMYEEEVEQHDRKGKR